MPGAGQWLDGKYFKGAVFILGQFALNAQANFNAAIASSLLGDTANAVQVIDYNWFMFCPCLYFLAAWDAYKEAGEKEKSLSFLPFVCAGYFGTVGIIYSSTFKPFGVLLGPVWLPMLGAALGGAIGCIIKASINKCGRHRRHEC